MQRWSDRAEAYRGSLGLVALVLCASCKEDVSLGSWLTQTQPTLQPAPLPVPASTPVGPAPVPTDAGVAPTAVPEAGVVDDGAAGAAEAGAPATNPTPDASPPSVPDAASGADAGASSPVCADVGEPGDLNAPGVAVGGTATNTDWTWPQPLDSVEFDFAVETNIGNDTYFWAYEFSFVAGPRGLLGMQGNGYYQAEPPTGEIEVSKMVQFWIGGPPLEAQLGDVDFPDARQAQEQSNGVPGRSIQTKFAWEPCHVYRFRLGLDGTDEDGNRWYGASILDSSTGESTYLGHMLIPLEWGRLSTTATMWTERFPLAATASCGDVQYSSVVFGIPSGNAGTVEPLPATNRFQMPAQCGSSRFTEFPGAIRHEVGVPRSP